MTFRIHYKFFRQQPYGTSIKNKFQDIQCILQLQAVTTYYYGTIYRWISKWNARKHCPEHKCLLQLIHPLTVSFLFFSPCLVHHLQVDLDRSNFTKLCGKSKVFCIERPCFLPRKPPMSLLDTSILKSNRSYLLFSCTVLLDVLLKTSKALIRETSIMKLKKNFQYFLEGLPTGFLALCCMHLSTPLMNFWYAATGGGHITSWKFPPLVLRTTGPSPSGLQFVLNTWT